MMKKPSAVKHAENDIETYRRLRRAIGYLGIALPIVLVILSLIPFFKTPVQSSISDYYYTNLREIFTGILCIVGLFLIRYKGFRSSRFLKNDNLLTNIAGYLAFGIALCPINPASWEKKIYTLIPFNIPEVGYFHCACAVVFFFILAMISINVFTIGQKEDHRIPISIFNENRIYRICGWLILFFLCMSIVFTFVTVIPFSTLIFEALALLSFGISWLVKGRFLGDKGKVGEKVYREFNYPENREMA